MIWSERTESTAQLKLLLSSIISPMRIFLNEKKCPPNIWSFEMLPFSSFTILFYNSIYICLLCESLNLYLFISLYPSPFFITYWLMVSFFVHPLGFFLSAYAYSSHKYLLLLLLTSYSSIICFQLYFHFFFRFSEISCLSQLSLFL